MTKRAFIIHGWGGYPEEGWFPWLKRELEKRDFTAQVPAMPDTDNPKIAAWVGHLTRLIGQPDGNTFLIGHSIGCQAIVRYIETLASSQKIGGVVLVAGWIDRLDGDMSAEEIMIAKPWLETKIDLAKVKGHCRNFTAIFSDNDPFVPLNDQNIFRDKLGAKIIIEHAKGHFSGSDGLTKLPACLKALESIL